MKRKFNLSSFYLIFKYCWKLRIITTIHNYYIPFIIFHILLYLYYTIFCQLQYLVALFYNIHNYTLDL